MGTKIQKLFQLLFISYKKMQKAGETTTEARASDARIVGQGTVL